MATYGPLELIFVPPLAQTSSYATVCRPLFCDSPTSGNSLHHSFKLFEMLCYE